MSQFNLSSGYAAGGGADALENLWKLLADNADMEQRRQLEQERIAIDRQRVKNESDYKNASLASLEAERAANEKLRAQQGADKLADDLPANNAISDATAAVLDKGGRGDLYQRNAALPTRTIRGVLRPSASGDGPMAIDGLQSDINPTGLKANNVYLGTPAQRSQAAQDKAFADIVASAPPAQRGRLQLIATLSPDKRMSSLVEMMREDAKPAEHSPAYKEWQDAVSTGYKGSFTQYQNDDANRHRPVDPLAGAYGRMLIDDPQLPRGVQDYLSQLRGKYDNFNGAQTEFNQALSSLRQAHPHLSTVKALNALREQYSGGGHQSSGDALLEELLQGNGGNPAPASGGASVGGRVRAAGPVSGGRGAAPVAPAHADAGRSVTTAELQAIAQRRGTTVQQEAQRATAAGYVVR